MTGWIAGAGAGLAVLVALVWVLRARSRARARHARLETLTLAPTSTLQAPASRSGATAQDPALRDELAAHAARLAAARAARSAQPSPAATTTTARSIQVGFDGARTTPVRRLDAAVTQARQGQPAPPVLPKTPPKAPVPTLTQVIAPTPTLTPAPQPQPPRRSQPRVLVADDSRIVRVKLSRLLTAQGFEVVEAGDGDEALRLAQEQRPDLLITDVDMPGQDGFALTRALRGRPATARLPVVMITAADDRHRDEAARAGVTVLLGKPFGEEALLAHLRRLLGLAAAAATA
ncbi:MAG: response regulator [Burkholderiaceae bacterium]|nr:response regulator [Burkholderiaceae bacterium]